MLALDRSHHEQSYPFSMDPSIHDPLSSLNTDGYIGSHPSFSAAVPQSYFDIPSFSVDGPQQAGHKGEYYQEQSHSASPSISARKSFEQVPSASSSASGPSLPSASSSSIGSPYQDNWLDMSSGPGFNTVGSDAYQEYIAAGMEPDMLFPHEKLPDSFVDPSLIQPIQQQSSYPPPPVPYSEEAQFQFNPSTAFPSASPIPSPTPHHLNLTHPTSSPYLPQHAFPHRPTSLPGRRSSISSIHSRRSGQSPHAGSVELDEDGKDKGRCPHPDCGRVFKDLKAHMLTHQSERPEKCPIVTCEYHFKGFARKYDKNRHTLTHYKGTMVCGFCPGSGSAAEKSFNRADVFKRHLTSVHGVEQTAPNCRKKASPIAPGLKVTGYSQDATGKCSTCSATFSNAQDFYEHLDDCVLRVVQQEEPSEAINFQRLSEISSDQAVRETMEKHMLLDADTMKTETTTEDNDEDEGSNTTPNSRSSKSHNSLTKTSASGPVGVSKPRPTISRRRNNRNNYPPSWGCPTNKMKMKKRVLCLYDGQRRLWKDEMMLDNEFEVRLRLPAGDAMGRDAYVTDLDVETMKRAQGVLNATEEEKGPWIHDPATTAGLIGPAAVPMLTNPQDIGDDLNIEELMN